MASGTSYEFVIPSAKPICVLDETGLDLESTGNGINSNKACVPKKKSTSFPTLLPQSVMLGSLLEHLCSLYEEDQEKAQELFKVICKQLERLEIISPVAYREDYASIRHQYKTSFYSLIKSSLSSFDSKLPLPSTSEVFNDKQKRKFGSGVFDLKASRYLEEYEEICGLGRGAYGTVFKVRNRIDGQEYAIKKVHIKDKGEQNCRSHIDRIRREVQSLAAMQQTNIVRYHYAWMEHHQVMQEDDFSCSNSSLPSKHTASGLGASNLNNSLGFEFKTSRENSKIGSSLSSLNLSHRGKFWNDSSDSSDSDGSSKMSSYSQDDSFSDGLQLKMSETDGDLPGSPDKVIYTHGVRNAGMRRVQSVILMSPSTPHAWSQSSNRLRVQSYSNLQDVAENPFNNFPDRPLPPVLLPKDEIVLYIQMQLCEMSLTSWLQERNRKCSTNANQDLCSVVDEITSLDILRQILQALAYIHSKDIMHRDVKPRNILLNGSRPHVLLGDFGLARAALAKQNSLYLSPLEDVNNFMETEQTTGVGTMIYAAPEQLEGGSYNTKADLYAVGIVLYELLWPIQTQHERVQSISELRQESIPEEFAQRWPKYVPTLKSLLTHDPSMRPTAQQVLDSDIFQISTTEVFFDQFANLKEENELLRKRLELCEQKLKQHGLSCD
uniref:non-specific serine/threonine protein kinase n=1 Tax=Phallusia mammillata TaxID=59560 RepID=A0A6F9DCA4_9ASCI|nr:eukaryotic translation initiation factor 2-alpha kinase 1-like [Phallusia mammillata]